ncbi:UNVERIFIED_CONTAM: hypothetical protein O8I53_13615 [Campylobacter lari]
MKIKKVILPLTISIMPLSNCLLSISLNEIKFNDSDTFIIYKFKDDNSQEIGILNTIQKFFPNNLILHDEHPAQGVVSYRFQREQNIFNLLRKDSVFIKNNKLYLSEIPNKYKNQSFDYF